MFGLEFKGSIFLIMTNYYFRLILFTVIELYVYNLEEVYVSRRNYASKREENSRYSSKLRGRRNNKELSVIFRDIVLIK